MTLDQFDELIRKFGDGWVRLDAEAVMSLIAHDDLTYYESTFNDPLTNWESVNKLWQIIPDNQKDVTFAHEMIVCNEHKAVVHVKVTRALVPSGEKQDIDAAFVFGTNDDGLINYFRQWRMLR